MIWFLGNVQKHTWDLLQRGWPLCPIHYAHSFRTRCWSFQMLTVLIDDFDSYTSIGSVLNFIKLCSEFSGNCLQSLCLCDHTPLTIDWAIWFGFAVCVCVTHWIKWCKMTLQKLYIPILFGEGRKNIFVYFVFLKPGNEFFNVPQNKKCMLRTARFWSKVIF